MNARIFFGTSATGNISWIYWWNFRKKNDEAYKNSILNGYPIICGTNYYTYLNFPVTPWSKYKLDRPVIIVTHFEELASRCAMFFGIRTVVVPAAARTAAATAAESSIDFLVCVIHMIASSFLLSVITS